MRNTQMLIMNSRKVVMNKMLSVVLRKQKPQEGLHKVSFGVNIEGGESEVGQHSIQKNIQARLYSGKVSMRRAAYV